MDAPSSTVKTCQAILQKAPPKTSGETLALLKDTLTSADACNELSQRIIDFPLTSSSSSSSAKDDVGKRFLCCLFNKFQQSYRSPHTNTFVPPLAGATGDHLPDDLRTFESHANEVWEAYTQLYYGKEALGSVYVKEATTTNNLAFIACFLIQKQVEDHDERLAQGEWNSAHIVHIGKLGGGGASSAKYKISSTIWITMDPMSDTSLSAQVSRSTQETHTVSSQSGHNIIHASHLENIGKMIETIEIDMRSNLDVVTIPKTRQVVSGLRARQQTQQQQGPRMGIPVMLPRRPKGGIAMPGMGAGGAAHAAALNAAVLKRAPKKL